VASGGATWDDAGVLDVGSGNTFTVADATVDDYFDDQAWWTFTVTSPSRVDLASSPHSNFALFSGALEADAELVAAIEADGSEAAGVTAYYLLPAGTYHLVVGVFGTPPTTYTVTYAPRLTGSSPWNDALSNDPDNVVTITDDESDWAGDVIRLGSYRIGDATYSEEVGEVWDSNAKDCAINHALWGNQISQLWDGSCPALFEGPADLEILGGSSVSYDYSEGTAFPWPFIPNSARMIVRTLSWGIWLKPVEENLPPFGVLVAPNPVDYGYPADAVIEWESPTVDLIGLEIADRAGTLGDDPDSRYAVNYNRQPTYNGGDDWDAWALGGLPGTPIPSPPWSDGPEDTTAYFPSEGVSDVDKTRYPLDVPADGFDSLAQDYVNDSYDYGVIAGPAEAFSERTLNADRTAAVGITLYVQVRSPRFRFIYDAPPIIPPRRIDGRSDGATHGSPRVRGGGNTVQSGSRVLGGIL
jgi:hypothetical protein